MNIIVTGASRGIGYELVKVLAQDPENRIIAISRNKQKLEALRQECLSGSPWSAVSIIPHDLADIHLMGRLTSQIEQTFKHVDVLVNNAGVLIHKPFEQLQPEDFDQMFTVNVKAVVSLIQSLLGIMNEGAHIVNIGSMGGFQGSSKFNGMSLYSASKGALAILTECLAEEFRPRGISVNMLALGSVDTEMLQQAFPGYHAPVNAVDMARYIASFSLSAHHFMNGKIIPLALSTP
jgi:short-subunit dehydrogenase